MTDAQHTEIVGLLRGILSALTYLCQPVDTEPDAPVCEHPEESRLDFSTPGEIDWTCQRCGHRERRIPSTRAPAPPPSASAEE